MSEVIAPTAGSAVPMTSFLDVVPKPPEGTPADSPLWLLYQTETALEARRPLVGVQEDYFQGRHKLSFATSTYREAFGQMLAAVSDNWIPLLIQAWVERLRPQGFSFNGQADPDAWATWQYNNLDSDAKLGFTEAGKHGEAYQLIWPEDRPMGVFGRFFRRRSADVPCRITLEHPSQMVVLREAGDRRRRRAALKKWREDDGTWFANLWTTGAIYRFQRTAGTGWTERAEGHNTYRIGVVPVVPLVHDPQMLPARPPMSLLVSPHNIPATCHVGLGRSDQVDVITTVDQLNKLLCDMLVASEFAAFRQRWATGLEVATDPDSNDPSQQFKAAVDRIWATASDKVKFGEFSETPLENYGKAMEGRIQSMAARKRTPPHYMLGSIINASGDSLKAAETGLESKTNGERTDMGEGLEEGQRVAFLWKGDRRAEATDGEVNWAPSEARSESEFVDSLVKKLSLGVPKEQLWKDAGYSPQQIAEFKRMLQEEAKRLGMFDVGAPDIPPEDPPEPPDPNAGD